jgi:hypothetical protein
MRIVLGDGHLTTFPPTLPILTESEGHKPARFDKALEISTGDGAVEEIDENMLLEAMPDLVRFLPHE